MKKAQNLRFLLLLILFISVVSILKSQNIVPNASFEESINFDTAKFHGWHKVQYSDTPDYFNFGDNSSGRRIFDNFIGGTIPKTGNGFIGIFCYRVHPDRNIRNIREFIETPLLSTMEKDSLYRIEISLCLDAESNLAIKKFGMHFPSSSMRTNQNLKLLSISPTLEFNSFYFESTNDWITLQTFYRAKGNEKYLVLGNFKTDRYTVTKKINPIADKNKKKKWNLSDNERATYYYIDDVVVEKIAEHQKIPFAIQKTSENLKDTFNIEKIKLDTAINLKNIIFNFNMYDLLPESLTEINKLYHLMITYPAIRIKLEGHTDNIGSYNFNLQLSLKRVESVANYLIIQGIKPDRIELAGYGFSNPLVPNTTEEGRRMNRRVMFILLEK